MLSIEGINEIFKFIKVFTIINFTYFFTQKIMNRDSKENKAIILLTNTIISIIYYYLRDKIGLIFSTFVLIGLLSIVLGINNNKKIGHTVLCTAISLAINNILFILATAITYIPVKTLKITNKNIVITFINFIYIILVYLFSNINKIKNGFDFLNTTTNDEYFDILFFNISMIVLFSVTLLMNYTKIITGRVGIAIIIFAFIMFITIQKSFKQYYKQKLLQKDLEETKAELAKKEKEIQELEAENISISKKAHTLSHKHKSLEHKINEMIMKAEISKEEAGEVKDRLNKIGKDLFKEKTAVELTKTEIKEIDEMLAYMQSECKKNKIDFELQIKGNIHYMTNNLISKEDLETLLADHIKNAIIAIKHTENINRSILVRLGEIDGNYSLYIYDSGIEFEKNTLEKLGKKPSTTHSDEGGTGMGFMNTFDTLTKCDASLMIEEYNEPNKDNYTKVIMIKFDNKNEFKIKSYR